MVVNFLKIFWCGPFLKSLFNLLQYCFALCFVFFGSEACGILAPWPGIKPTPSALEGQVLTTGPPGRSLVVSFKPILLAVYCSSQETGKKSHVGRDGKCGFHWGYLRTWASGHSEECGFTCIYFLVCCFIFMSPCPWLGAFPTFLLSSSLPSRPFPCPPLFSLSILLP